MTWVHAEGGFARDWLHAEYILDEHDQPLARVAYEGYLSGLDRKPVWMAWVKYDGEWMGVGRETTDKDEAKRVAEKALAIAPPRQMRMF
jgi:hypothetical protein